MSNTTTAPAPTQAAVAPVLVSMTETEKMIQRESGLSLDDMPDSFTVQSGNDNPIVATKPFPFPLPKGKVDLRPVTICDVNGPKYNSDFSVVPGSARFAYAWLSEEDKKNSQFEGYRYVRDDNEGSVGPNGEKIMSHYFNDHVIRRGSTHFCFAKAGYAQGQKEHPRQKARLMAASLGKSGSAQAEDRAGNAVPGIMLGSPEDNKRQKR